MILVAMIVFFVLLGLILLIMWRTKLMTNGIAAPPCGPAGESQFPHFPSVSASGRVALGAAVGRVSPAKMRTVGPHERGRNGGTVRAPFMSDLVTEKP